MTKETPTAQILRLDANENFRPVRPSKEMLKAQGMHAGFIGSVQDVREKLAEAFTFATREVYESSIFTLAGLVKGAFAAHEDGRSGNIKAVFEAIELMPTFSETIRFVLISHMQSDLSLTAKQIETACEYLPAEIVDDFLVECMNNAAPNRRHHFARQVLEVNPDLFSSQDVFLRTAARNGDFMMMDILCGADNTRRLESVLDAAKSEGDFSAVDSLTRYMAKKNPPASQSRRTSDFITGR